MGRQLRAHQGGWGATPCALKVGTIEPSMREKAPLTGGRVCASWQPPRQQRSLSSKCTLRAAALPEAAGYVLKCMLSPDVRQLATTSSDKTVKLWNLDGFTLDRTLAGGWAARPWSVRAGAGSAGAAPASGARRARAARAAELVRLVALAPRPRPPNLQAAGAGWGLRAPCCPCWLQPPIPACGARQPLPPPPPPRRVQATSAGCGTACFQWMPPTL